MRSKNSWSNANLERPEISSDVDLKSIFVDMRGPGNRSKRWAACLSLKIIHWPLDCAGVHRCTAAHGRVDDQAGASGSNGYGRH